MFSILLTIFGLAAILIFSIQVYKTAVSTERNAVGWTFITVGIGIAFQFIIPFVLSVAIVLYYVWTSTDLERSMSEAEGPLWVVSILSLIISVVGMMTVSKHVSKVIDIPVGSVNAPP